MLHRITRFAAIAAIALATVTGCTSGEPPAGTTDRAGSGSDTSAAGTPNSADTSNSAGTSDSAGTPASSGLGDGSGASSSADVGSAGPSPIPLVAPGEAGLVVGHRGNAAGAPEDTLASEVSAERVGAQVLEFDLHMTADGVPVVMHDDTVDRTTDGTGRISSLTLAQIQRLDAGSSYSPAFAGTPVPTFERILRFAAPTSAIILPELKEPHWTDAQLRTVVDLIRRYHMASRTMFQSFSVPVLQQVARIAPDIARAGLVTDAPADPVAFVGRFDGQGLLPEDTAVTRQLVSTLHRAGLSIMVWTVDDPAGWASLTADGVDGIMSNNPGALAGWIQAYRRGR